MACRLLLMLLITCLTIACGDGAAARAAPLTGTWLATGTLMTTSMVKTGQFRLRIRPDGRYSLVSAPGAEFVVDAGRFTSLSTSAYARLTSTGAEERGTVVRDTNGWRLAGTYGALRLQPAAADAALDAALDRVATVFALDGLRSVSAWTSRAMQVAQLWHADARLVSVSVTDFADDGTLRAGSGLSMLFASRASDRTLLVAPVRIELPALFAQEVTRQSSTPTQGIPVPIRDLQSLVAAARDRGQRGRLQNARLQVYEDRARGSKLLWIADVPGGFDRWCMAGTTGELVDCRQWDGDPKAEFEALARRAEAGWRALQQRWNPPAQSATFEFQPPSDYDRCRGAGGRYVGANCYDYYDKQIYP